jgi:ABC-type antimicrobial peptide transport system permease subunit
MTPPVTQPPRTLPLLAIGVVGMLVAQQALVVVGDALVVASIVDAQALPPLLRSALSTLSATLALQMLLDVGILIAWSGLMRWLVRRWVARG